jgi:hypothetical protein
MASSIPQTLDVEESRSQFRQRIVRELASYLPPDSAQESLSGVMRQVRHMGAPHQVREPGARAQTKRAVQGIQASVSQKYSAAVKRANQTRHADIFGGKRKGFCCAA